ncbi:MAG: alpha/beta hydrolase [Smithellaceae bacterium]
MPFFITDDGVRLYYELSGAGRPVVFIHGLTASSRHFHKQISEFSGRYQVIAPDLRGHGQSEASPDRLTMARLALDLRQLLAQLKIDRFSVVGWSMGAHVLFEFIKQYGPERVERIVIIDMAPRLMKSKDWHFGLPGIFSRKTGDFGHEDNLFLLSVMLDDWSAYSRVLARRLLNKSLFNEKMEFDEEADFPGKNDLPWLEEEAGKNNASVIAAFWISMVLQDYRPVLKAITVPCLLTYGTESNYYPPGNYDYMVGQLPAARVMPFEKCGHALHIQAPEAFNSAVMKYLE